MECTSCKRKITPKEKMVKFPCPECEMEIIRCEKCRVLGNKYKCPGCEFEGP
ncbi:MAG: zinc finger domain-containing protein [Candidatus Methanofastidiosia archaeon]